VERLNGEAIRIERELGIVAGGSIFEPPSGPAILEG
jgi:hypothetical protein